MRYKGYVVTYAGEALKINKENYFLNGICRENLDQPDIFQINKDFGRRNFYAVSSGVKCDKNGDELSQIAVDVLKGFYGADFAEEGRSYFDMANSAINSFVFEKRDGHFEVDTSVLYIENDIATVYNFGDVPVFYFDKGKLKKLSGDAPETVEIEKNVYDNNGTVSTQVLKKHNIPHLGFMDEEGETVPYVSESIKLKHKAFFVLCSKAVYDVVGEKAIADVLADKQLKGGNKAARIIDLAVKEKPEGNYTALVVCVDKGIPVTDSDARSVGIWATIALLCAVLYFTSPYILSAVSVVAESTKAFIENYFGEDDEPNEDIKWPRDDMEEHQQSEDTEENAENGEQSDDVGVSIPETEVPQTNSTPNTQRPTISQSAPAEQKTEEQKPEQQTGPQPEVELPGTTTPPEINEDVELPIDFN